MGVTRMEHAQVSTDKPLKPYKRLQSQGQGQVKKKRTTVVARSMRIACLVAESIQIGPFCLCRATVTLSMSIIIMSSVGLPSCQV